MSWPISRLGEVISFIRGVTFTPEDQVEPLSDGSTVVMRTKNVQVAGLDQSDLIAVPSGFVRRKEQSLREGDILVSSANSWELVGKASYVPKLTYEATAGGFISIVRAKESLIDSRYLYHWVVCPATQHKIRHCGRQTTNISNLDVGRFQDLEIPLPPLPEQKRIAAILDKADAIRRKRQQAIQLADDFLRAVFLDMFGDPVINPKGFRKGSITELADIITGNAFKSDEYVSDSEVAVRLCRGTNVLTSYFDWSDTAYWPKDQLDGLERYLLSSGDVILAMDRPWISSGLKVCIFPDQEVDTYLVQRVARLRPKEAMFSEYIYSCIKSQAFEKHCCPTETTVPHISPVELRGYEVLIPDKTTLANYHVTVGKIKSAITGMQDAASYAGNAFESLSQKAFSGQL